MSDEQLGWSIFNFCRDLSKLLFEKSKMFLSFVDGVFLNYDWSDWVYLVLIRVFTIYSFGSVLRANCFIFLT